MWCQFPISMQACRENFDWGPRGHWGGGQAVEIFPIPWGSSKVSITSRIDWKRPGLLALTERLCPTCIGNMLVTNFMTPPMEIYGSTQVTTLLQISCYSKKQIYYSVTNLLLSYSANSYLGFQNCVLGISSSDFSPSCHFFVILTLFLPTKQPY